MTVTRRVTSPTPMAAPPSPYLGLLNDGSLMPMHKQGKNRSPGEEEAIHNPKSEGSLQQRTGLIDIQAQMIVILLPDIPIGAQGEVE